MLNVGEAISFRRVLLQADFDRFARLSGDDNPIHCDPEYARHTHFGATVSHGMLLYGLIAKALGEMLPGARQLAQELMFPNPTFAGEVIEVALEVLSLLPGGAIKLATRVSKENGSLACAEGISLVLPPGAVAPEMPSIMAAASAPGETELYGLSVGQSASLTRNFTGADLAEYGDLVGDRNPVFRGDQAIIPGPLLAGLFSDLLGTHLPGRGTGWMKQRLAFLNAVRPGEDLAASVHITRLRAAKDLVNLATRVRAADGRLAVDGEALVLVRDLEAKKQARS